MKMGEDGEVPLPPSVDAYLHTICGQQGLPWPETEVLWLLVSKGEEFSKRILSELAQTRVDNLNRMIRKKLRLSNRGNSQSPQTPSSFKRPSPLKYGESSSSRVSKIFKSTVSPESAQKTSRQLFYCKSELEEKVESPPEISPQLMILSELEFRRLFLVLSYIGREKLEDVISCERAGEIVQMKDLTMGKFESEIWNMLGRLHNKTDRVQYSDWDYGKTHFYYCHVTQDGSYYFKGPHLNTTKTHLQRALGDENILIVKFEEVGPYTTKRIAARGILVGHRRYRFFVFKDERNEVKKKTLLDKKKKPTHVKSYFVRIESFATCSERETYSLTGKSIYEARCHFMHVHKVSSMAKYMARFSLILSKTIKLPVDLSSVHIQLIEDVSCKDETGHVIYDEKGQPLIHTDGTGFISEDLAAKCPKNLGRVEYIKDDYFQKILEFVESAGLPGEGKMKDYLNTEPPLLMQCRLFNNGRAVKGTLLVNKKLEPGTIQIRPSMVKVEADANCLIKTFNSLEVVAISQKPKRGYLSKNLIALLSYGGVPDSYFLDLLDKALAETRTVYYKKRAAFRVAINHGETDDNFMSARMIASGVPLSEPYLQLRLSQLANEEKTKFRQGKLPISESFYLMGTSDPTGSLNSDEVCVILENGQISGKVLVYRNPALHFGDVHIMTAKYVKGIEDIVGNAKYGIFFSTKGRRSAATEMGNGDFDGDVYWISRNPELLNMFKGSEPWCRIYSTPPAAEKKPSELSNDGLEVELIQLFQEARKPSSSMATAADSWLALMDRFLTLGIDRYSEKAELKRKILLLIDIYYDALDAPKSGKKVIVPSHLKAEKYPHHMGKGDDCDTYESNSVLGRIYDAPELLEPEVPFIEDISKLSCLDVELSELLLREWEVKYKAYRDEMSDALRNPDADTKKTMSNEVIKKYKKILYEADDLEGSLRRTEEIYNEALAMYHVSYEHANRVADVKRCSFAWKVAGSALCKIHALKQNEKPISILPSVLHDLL